MAARPAVLCNSLHRKRRGLEQAGELTFKLIANEPGMVLTALTIEQLLDRDWASEINSGPGADPYKRSWAGQMCEMQGILAFNRGSWRGRPGIARHIWARGVKRALKRVVLRGPTRTGRL